ncbi:MAG: tRNA lysidine(34) synthetase TilS [Dehalococcoidia bacterium]
MPPGFDFVQAVEAALQNAGVDFNSPLLVAFSGGPDSTALLLACCELRSNSDLVIHAGHLNHRLRGAESDKDADFVVQTCEALDVPCHMDAADMAAIARERGMSLEAAAREARYDFLARTAAEIGAQAVVTGHTLDDQAETVLLHVARGSGLRGLAGMRPVMERPATALAPAVRVVRPLLKIRRTETVGFCELNGVTPRVDASNEDVQFSRNRIRHQVLPALEEVNLGVVESVARLAENAASDMEIIKGAVQDALGDTAAGDEARTTTLDRRAFNQISPALSRRVLMTIFENAAGTPQELEQAHVEDMRRLALGHAGTSLDLPRGLRFEVDYHTLRIVHTEAPDERCPYPAGVPSKPLEVPGTTELGGGFQLVAELVDAPPDPGARANPMVAFLETSLADGGLHIRSRQPGDRFHPLGMTENVKLQDFFVGAHVPRTWRDRAPLVVSPRGIAWVAGCRPAEWARLPADAKQALRLALKVPHSHTE